MKINKKIVAISILLMILMIGYIIVLSRKQPEVEIVKVENNRKYLDEKIDVLENLLIKNLTECESNGVEEPDGYVKLDSNDVFSWGRLQFQRNTVVHYVKKFYGEDISLQRATLIAWDLDKEIPLNTLTKKIIFETKDGVWEWANCARKLDLESEIKFINKLKE